VVRPGNPRHRHYSFARLSACCECGCFGGLELHADAARFPTRSSAAAGRLVFAFLAGDRTPPGRCAVDEARRARVVGGLPDSVAGSLSAV